MMGNPSHTDITVQILISFALRTGRVEMREPGVRSKEPYCRHGSSPLRGFVRSDI